MNQKNWDRIEKVRNYLESRKKSGIEKFSELLQKVKKDPVAIVVITFTYEHLEVFEKIGNEFTLNTCLTGVINRYEIEALNDYDYDCDNEFEDFEFTQVSILSSELIKWWIADCFQQAREREETSAKFYYKEMHDHMEIVELNTFQTLYEKMEFETFVKNNQFNLIQLLQE